MRVICVIATAAMFIVSPPSPLNVDVNGAHGSNARQRERKRFELAGHAVQPGTRLDIDVPVPAGADPATYVPITVFHGSSDGPVLALTMGVHGYEYPSILAGQALLELVNPRELRGTLMLVRIAHVEAFENRVPYVNPFDRKNLNRVFPGRMDGTQSDRIAWVLTTEVIRRCDIHVDVHSGDGAEWLEPFVGVYGGKLAEAQYARSRAAGLAFGFENIVKYSMDTQEQMDGRGRSLNRQAVADAKPTVLVEIGENGRRDQEWVERIVNGVENLLRTLQMTAGRPAPPPANTRWFDGTVGATSSVTGIFTPTASRARMVRKGDPIGTVRSYTGRVLEEIASPADGYVLYGFTGPSVKAGESVVTIARPASAPL